MSWGYKHSTRSFSEEMQTNKKIINTTFSGTKIYKSVIGKGGLEASIIWHDNRNTKYPSFLIIQKQSFNIDNLKSQKEIFKFAEDKLRELKIITCI
jgi:hypothetical protein